MAYQSFSTAVLPPNLEEWVAEELNAWRNKRRIGATLEE